METGRASYPTSILDEEAIRRDLATAARLEGGGAYELFHVSEGDRLTRMDPSGTESPLVNRGLPWATGTGGKEGVSRDVIPIELGTGELWGYWAVPAGESGRLAGEIPRIANLAGLLNHLDDDRRIREAHDALWSVFGLGHALGQAEDPETTVSAIHEVCGPVLRARLTALVILGQSGARAYRCAGGEVDSTPTRPEAWRAVCSDALATWRAESPTASLLSDLLGEAGGDGMAMAIGEADRPVGFLAVLGDGPFSERDRGLFARIVDLVFASLARWEQLEGVRRKARQVSDLFVLLAQEKERLDYVLRSVPVGLLLCDADGTISLANQSAAVSLGLTDVELRENKVFESRPAGRALLGLVRKAREEGRAVSTPYEMESRWFQVQVVPWPGGVQFLVVTQDIQDWYQSYRLKEDLISIISHEVKNPLTAIINAAGLLSSGRPGALTDHQTRIAALIQENGQSIRDLLDDVVRLSRIHHASDHRDRVAVQPLIEKVRDAIRDTVQGKLLVWRESLEDLQVAGEPRMLENLFTNLVGNAVKYVGIGGYVGVRAWMEGGRARIRVVDDGPGIPADERDKLFTPFFRASNVRDRIGGTGLGLVIARNIVERLGGRLEVTSPLADPDLAFLGCSPGNRQGSAFDVSLPLWE